MESKERPRLSNDTKVNRILQKVHTNPSFVKPAQFKLTTVDKVCLVCIFSGIVFLIWRYWERQKYIEIVQKEDRTEEHINNMVYHSHNNLQSVDSI